MTDLLTNLLTKTKTRMNMRVMWWRRGGSNPLIRSLSSPIKSRVIADFFFIYHVFCSFCRFKIETAFLKLGAKFGI